jgi:hypothetical protein
MSWFIILSAVCGGYVLTGFAVNRAVRCAHYLGYGEEPPRRRAAKCGALWPWYVATWVLQWLYMKVRENG